MTHLKKHQHHHHHHKTKDVAVVGRLGGGYPVPASDWYQDLYGVGFTGVGNYSGSDMDATSSQGMDSDDTTGGTEATGDAAGGTAAGSSSV